MAIEITHFSFEVAAPSPVAGIGAPTPGVQPGPGELPAAGDEAAPDALAALRAAMLGADRRLRLAVD
jgi:hypothetical protein